jgi:hypothetical protein
MRGNEPVVMPVVLGVALVGLCAGLARGAIVVETFSGSLTQEASVSTPGSLPINETWSTTSTSPINTTRSYSVPTVLVEPWARAMGTITTTYGAESLRVESAFQAEASTFGVSSGTASARSVGLILMTFTITQAGDYTIRGGANVTTEGFGTALYNTSVNMTGPVNLFLPSVDGPFNPNTVFVRSLVVGTYTLSTLATVAGESTPGTFMALAGSTKFEITAVPAPGVLGMGLVVGLVGLRRRR